MQFSTDLNSDIVKRLRRLEGQVRGLQRLVEEGADCRDIVIQLAAAQGALDRVGFKLMASALSQPRSEEELTELESLFLKLS